MFSYMVAVLISIEFQTWKSNVEKESKTQYCAERGLQKWKNCTQCEYVCHCSYQPALKTIDRNEPSRV